MKQRIFVILLAVSMLMSGCNSGQSLTPDPTSVSNEMAELPPDAGIDEMVRAYQTDYANAARRAGIKADHNDLEYTVDEGKARTQWGRMIVYIEPPSTYHRVWYAGFPESEDWLRREIQLILLAGDSTLSVEDAALIVNDMYEEAWSIRDQSPSALIHQTPGGLSYSLGLSDSGLISFWIWFDR